MLNRVRFADSSAMLASRMRLSAAFVFTTCDCARRWRTAGGSAGYRPCSARRRACRSRRRSRASAACASAESVQRRLRSGRASSCRPRRWCRAIDAVGRRRLRADEHREARRGVEAGDRRLRGRFPSMTVVVLVLQLARCRRRRLDDDACVASVARRSSSVRDVVERAVLDLQRRQAVVGVADALVQDRLLAAVAVRDREAGRVVTRAC